MWDKGVEQLGKSCNRADGIRFFHFGRHWKKNRPVFLLWKINIPSASLREADEFEQDLSLSLWVDWNQDEMWDKNERVSHKQINISRFFPTNVETKCIYYLTWFRVADLEGHMFSSRGGTKDMVNLWVRGVLSYDDPDASPDGDLLFGEAEDYRVTHRKR